MALERPRIESKELLHRKFEYRLKPTNEISRVKRTMEVMRIGVPSGSHGSYVGRSEYIQRIENKEKWVNG